MNLTEILTENDDYNDAVLSDEEQMKFAEHRLKIIEKFKKLCGSEIHELVKHNIIRLSTSPLGLVDNVMPCFYTEHFYNHSSSKCYVRQIKNDSRLEKFKKLDKALQRLAPDGEKTITKLKTIYTRFYNKLTVDTLSQNRKDEIFDISNPHPKVILFDYKRPDVSRKMNNPYYYLEDNADIDRWSGKPENFDWVRLASRTDTIIYHRLNVILKKAGTKGFEKMYAAILPEKEIKFAILGAGAVDQNGLSAILENIKDGKLFLRLGNSALHADAFCRMSEIDQIRYIKEHLKI